MLKTKRQAFAEHCQIDFESTEDYRYHYGRTKTPVWAISDNYITITKGEKPPKFNGSIWDKKEDAFLQSQGYQAWVIKCD